MMPSVQIIESGSFSHSISVVKRRRIEGSPKVKDAGGRVRVIPITPLPSIICCASEYGKTLTGKYLVSIGDGCSSD